MQEISYFFDRIQGEKEKEERRKQAKVDRIKQVRQQELEISKRVLQENQQKAEESKKEQVLQEKFQEYLKKKQQIEDLGNLKSQNLKEIGNISFFLFEILMILFKEMLIKLLSFLK